MNPFTPTTTSMDSIQHVMNALEFDIGVHCQEICIRSDIPLSVTRLVDMFYYQMYKRYKKHFKIISTTSYIYNNDQHFFITFEVTT